MSTENIVPSSASETTKVFYYLDDDPTPYMSLIQTAAEAATLGHFKRAFTRKGFKYYAKLLDPDIGREVKVELIGEESKLARSQNGLFELFLLSAVGNQNGGGGGTLQRKTNNGTLSRRVGKERNEREHAYNPRHTTTTASDDYDSSSRQETLLSRRAGEVLAESMTSASEHPYEYDDSRNYNAAMGDEASRLDGPRRRKARKTRVRKSYVPSTIGSQPESSGTSLSLPRILEVNLQIGPNDLLGISVVSVEGSILISDVFPGGIVARDGRIDVGDQIVQVNTRSFENLSDHQAIMILRKVAAAKKPLTLYVAKRTLSTTEADPLCTLASETMPLDISLWVENAVHCTERQRFGVDSTIGGGTEGGGDTTALNDMASVCTEDEEEERMLYVQRRNGPSAAAAATGRRNNGGQRAAARGGGEEMMMPPGSGLGGGGGGYPPDYRGVGAAAGGRGGGGTAMSEGSGYTERLTSRMNPHSLVSVLSHPNSGLTVKNRKWLKIPVPQSFIGVELVDWLALHVDDLRERKEARKYAAYLLEKGLIKHVVSKRDFTEKCYYVFSEGVASGSRNGLGSAMMGEGAGREGGGVSTEMTYLDHNGTLDSSGPPNNRLPASSHDNTWPFSPITVVHKRGVGHRAECESDYASVVGSSFPLPSTRRPPPPNTPLSPSQFEEMP